MEKASERNCNLDLIRVVACFAVVGIHSFPKDLSVATATVYYAFGFAVPFFFMASGYFLLNRGNVSGRYSLHKILGVVRTVMCWNLIVFIAKVIKQLFIDHNLEVGLLTFPIECVKSLVQKGTMWQFWYMGALLILYCLLPVISRFSKGGKRKLMIFAGIVAVVLEVCSVISGYSVQANVIQTFRIWTWLFYFILGSELNQITKMIGSKVEIRIHIALTVLITVCNVAYQNYAGVHFIVSNTGIRLHAEYFYDSLLEVVWVTMLFSLLLRLNLSGYTKCFVKNLAPLTMGIYVVHPLLLRVVQLMIPTASLGSAFVCWIITTISSAIITWIVSKTPLKNCLLKV